MADYGLAGDTNARGHMIKRWCSKCSDAHPGAARSVTMLCETCGVTNKRYGFPGGRRQWCHKCSTSHAGAVLLDKNSKPTMCMDCGLKQGSFGAPGASRINTWCKPCAEAGHPGYVNTRTTQCEDCNASSAVMGRQGERNPGHRGGKVRRWCRPCGARHPEAVELFKVSSTARQPCEQCGGGKREYGLPCWAPGEAARHGEGSARTAALHHRPSASYTRIANLLGAAVSDAAMRREPRYGQSKRWCRACAAGRPGAVHWEACRKLERRFLLPRAAGLAAARVGVIIIRSSLLSAAQPLHTRLSDHMRSLFFSQVTIGCCG
jgi:hypothetical protein